MKRKELISVIIPVYKVEDLLDRCVNSILNQIYSNLEIILVDDGSPDNCGAVCDQYATEDKRIRVIHKENGGLSSARNAGLKIATGKYVTFVDSDDYINNNMLEILYNNLLAANSDISICNFQSFSDESEVMTSDLNILDDFTTYSNEESLEILLYNRITNCSWGKLFRKELFDDIEFPEGKIMEDLATTYKLFAKSKSISISKKKLYFYYLRPNSIMRSEFSNKKIEGMDAIVEETVFIKSRFPQLINAAICNEFRCSYENLLKIPHNKRKSVEKYKLLRKNIKKNRRIVLFDKKAPTKYRLFAFISYFGIDTFLMIKKLINEIRGN